MNCIMLMGLPNSGKTTWAKEFLKDKDYKDHFEFVSADDMKEAHKDYDPNNVTNELHEWSVNKAENLIYELAAKKTPMIVDSGSINNSYTIRIITTLKDLGYTIQLVHVKTPYMVCLERNALRERKVPQIAITDKALKETSQFHKLAKLSTMVKVIDYFTHEHIFVDMDGVIAAQSTLPIVNGCIDFVNGEVHKWLAPVIPVIAKLNGLAQYHNKTLYILSATPNSFSSGEKREWLKEHFPMQADRIFFVNQGKHKAEMLDNLRRKFKLQKHQVTLIDDLHETLYKVEDRGMRGMHPSEFLTHKF